MFNGFYNSPIGLIRIQSDDYAITSLNFELDLNTNLEERQNSVIDSCVTELDAYFNGKLKIFSVPFVLNGSEFQKKVWSCLLTVPYGKTASYKEIAYAIGNPNACRAVGNANRNNNISIIIPCHRIIGADGSLTGYGGQLWRKQWLLEHEKKIEIKK